ncbi:MAG: DNA polymerase III subunit alpha [Oscillospiraceae bacterium]|nr:DNA polymerase III subunit alpha [Oscillospiraceae bacterium]
MSYVDLNVHTEYSLLEGACRLGDLVEYAAKTGKKALALTDTGNMFAAVKFWDECSKHGIKPVIGCEISLQRGKSSLIGHPRITLLCKDAEGYRDLCKLVTLSYKDEINPHISMEELSQYSKGLICLVGDKQSDLYRFISDQDIPKAYENVREFKDIFGDDLYIRVSPAVDQTEKLTRDALFRLADGTSVKTAAVVRTMYVRPEDVTIQRTLAAIGTSIPVGEGHHLHSEEEMRREFGTHPEAVDNTGLIADKCSFEMEYGHYHFPAFKQTPKQRERTGGDNIKLFREICRKGLIKRYGTVTEELSARLGHELEVIISMGFTDYFLIVWDFVSFAKRNDIPVGPGRGSGAGSLAAYCMGITDIDPIRYSLLFERFLNPERISMPDFDIDFCYERRQEVIDYVVQRYGRDRVCMIVTFGTLAAKAAVRDITRVQGKPYAVGDRISRCIPSMTSITLDSALKEYPDLKKLYETDREAREVIDTARYIEGMPRNTSTHAAGVVICDAPVSDYVPVIVRDGVTATQYTMTDLEKTGLVKMDFLGLRNLTIIHDCEEFVRRSDPAFSKDFPDDDRKTYDMLSDGDTLGVFQFESEGMTHLLKTFRPRSIEDLTAAIALYRPGPMESIPRYLKNRQHPEGITYKHPCLKDILDVTFGCVVYQEQVMQICRKMAGYSLGRADLVRRAMSKKKADVMEKERPAFIEGSVRNGIDEHIAAEVFDELTGFASYAFNKSHAAAYSVVAYTTAYLKCHYPKEYLAAYMTANFYSQGKISECMAYCAKHSIAVLPPDINESGMGFTPCPEGIRFSLMSAKNVGANIAADVIKERKNGAFTSLTDLASRVRLNRKAAESLIKCGALDSMPHNRRTYLENLDLILNETGHLTSDRIDGQLDLFGGEKHTYTEVLEDMAEFPKSVLLAQEYEIMGMYITGHPLDDALIYAACAGIPPLGTSGRSDQRTAFVCMVDEVREHTARSGDKMAFLKVSGKTSETDVVVFPEAYRSYRQMLTIGAALLIEGNTSVRDGRMNVICERIVPAKEFIASFARRKLYIHLDSRDRQRIDRCVGCFDGRGGECTVLFVFDDIRRTISHRTIKSCELSADLLRRLSEITNISIG